MTDENGNLKAEGELFSYINSRTGCSYDMTEYVNDITKPNTEVLMEETSKRMQTYHAYGNTRESSNSIWEDSKDCFANETGYYQYDGHCSVTSVTNDLCMVKDVFRAILRGSNILGQAGL